MEKQKEFDRTSDACLDCIHMLAVIDGANWMITDVAHKYADFLTEDDKKKLDEVKRDLKECTHKTNSALEGIFSKLSTFIQPAASKPKYESFIIPRELIDYENDKKILLHIPDEMEYGGYSTWFSKKFVTDDPSGGLSMSAPAASIHFLSADTVTVGRSLIMIALAAAPTSAPL